MSELCLNKYYVHEFVTDGDTTTPIFLPCVRERVPSTNIEECGDNQNWRDCCRKEKTLLLLPQNVPQFLEEEVNWMMIQSTRGEEIILSRKYNKSNRV